MVHSAYRHSSVSMMICPRSIDDELVRRHIARLAYKVVAAIAKF